MPIPPSIAGAVALLGGLGCLSFFCSLRWLARKMVTFERGRWGLLLAVCGTGILVFGIRLVIAEGQVSWMPYLDQWEAEIGGMVAPLAHGTLTAGDLFAANNEHRVILTRVVSLAVVELNGAWDNRITIVGMFILQSATAAWICAIAWIYLGWARGSLVGAAVVLPMFLICDWENIVSGFQDQFGFMILGSVVVFSMSDRYSLKSVDGWAVLVMALLLLGSMASGLLTAAVMVWAGLMGAMAGRRGWKTTAGFCAACAAIAALGWFTRNHAAQSPALYAQGLHAWWRAFLAYSAWPLPPNVPGFLCLWLPWFILLAQTLRRREARPFALFSLALGLWVLLQAGGLAWSRAGLSGLVSARYTEVVSLGFVANAAALVFLLSSVRISGKTAIASWTAMAIWLAMIGRYEVWRSHAIYRPYFKDFRHQTLEQEQRVGTFVRTGDASVIERAQFPQIPDQAEIILPLLRDPLLQPLLPAPLRREFVRDRNPAELLLIKNGPLSFIAIRALRNGLGFILIGLALLGVAFIWTRRTVVPAPPAR